jgi:8-oxo-dGTP pyrophosphatase MutT (NUDIX family)
MLAKRRLACENSRFSVYFDDLTRGGEPYAQDYLVVAPKQVAGNLVTGVAILPVCEGKIGLLKVYRHAVQNDSWEIPRGFVEEGESDVTSALRELEEETGLACEASQIKSLGYVTPDAGILAARVHIYAALRCMRTKPYVPLEFGHQEFRLFSRDEIETLIARSEIQDPCTLIARYKFVQTNS